MPEAEKDSPRLPLVGVRVLEFCQVAAGPFCGMLLADMGADVIKIESETGDSMRQWPPFNKGYSENFASVNRSKRSVALDLKSDAGRAAALRLVETADIVIENNRPGVMKRLGLDFETLSRIRPALVYGSISAFGQTGPRAAQGGFDLTIQGISGIMSVTGEAGGAPVKCGVPISDFCAGLYAAYAIAAMLPEARRTGRGAHIDVPMIGTSLGVAALQTSQYFGTGTDPEKLGSAHPRNAPYQAFKARDGYFVMAAGNNKLWHSVCEALNRPDLLDDPDYETTVLRAANQVALKETLEAQFAARDVADLLGMFSARGIPCGPINSYSEALEDPQVAHFDWVRPISLPGGGETRTFVSPISISGRAAPDPRRPPALGEHNAEILKELQIRREAGE